MSVAEPSRLVWERKISRKVSPVVSPAGIRLQSEGTSVGGGRRLGQLQLDRVADGPAETGTVPPPVVGLLGVRVLECEALGVDVQDEGLGGGGEVRRNPQLELSVVVPDLHRRHLVVGHIVPELVLGEIGGVRASVARGTVCTTKAAAAAGDRLGRERGAPDTVARRRGGRPAPRLRPVAVALGVGGAHLHLVRGPGVQAPDGGAGAGHVLGAVGPAPARALAVAQVVVVDVGTGGRRRGPAHVQAGGGSLGHHRRIRWIRGLVHVGDLDRHRDPSGSSAVAVVGLDDDGVAGLDLVVVGHVRLGLDLGGAGGRRRVELEGQQVGAFEAVGQRVHVKVGGGQDGAHVRARCRVLGQLADRRRHGERRVAVGALHAHPEDRREPVHGAVFGWILQAASYGTVAGI